MAQGILEQLDGARAGLDEACELLLRPSTEALDECAARCQRAAAELAECQPKIHSARGKPEVLAAARRLSAAVRSARRLLENAATYHNRWQALLGALSGGYVRGGEPAPVIHAERFVLRA